MPWQILYVDPSSTMQQAMELTWRDQDVRLHGVRRIQDLGGWSAGQPLDLAIVAAAGRPEQTLEAIAAVRAATSSARLPILLLAAADRLGEAAALAGAQVDAAMAKPFQVAAFTEQALALIARGRTKAAKPAAFRGLPPPARGSLGSPAAIRTSPPARGRPSPTAEELREMARAAVEAVAWEVVPDLAETLVAQHLQRQVKG